MILKLPKETIESGQEHPFVLAVLREMKERLHGLRETLQVSAGVGDLPHHKLCQLGGRAFELSEWVRSIETAQGVERE